MHSVRTLSPSKAGRIYGKHRPILRTGKPNMPKQYPCPECRATSKRTTKLPVGAYYKCRTHGEFLIRRGKS